MGPEREVWERQEASMQLDRNSSPLWIHVVSCDYGVLKTDFTFFNEDYF